MNQGKYVFAQVIEFLPQRILDKFVKKYDGNKYVKHFTCWNQLLCMIFGQLTNRESLPDVIIAINAHNTKCYHLGFGKSVCCLSIFSTNTTAPSELICSAEKSTETAVLPR